MEPNTASRLRERKSNSLKDYVAMSGPLGVSHMTIISQTERGTNLRMTRLPKGPTFTFRVEEFTLRKDIIANQKNAKSPGVEYLTSPLLVLNNFNTTNKESKLMTSMFQSMFPQINVGKINLKDMRRVVLFNYNQDKDTIDYRHYLINTKVVGVSKSIKKIFKLEDLPSMSKYGDVSEFVLQDAYASEASDAEDVVDLPQNYIGRHNKKNDQRAIVLTEIGPRMELKLLKIESGFCGGEVLYHSYIKKTREQIEENEKMLAQKIAEKNKRRQVQEENIKKKVKFEDGKEQVEDLEDYEAFDGYEIDDINENNEASESEEEDRESEEEESEEEEGDSEEESEEEEGDSEEESEEGKSEHSEDEDGEDSVE
jgi:ribosome biogenesis protein SSF1/2